MDDTDPQIPMFFCDFGGLLGGMSGGEYVSLGYFERDDLASVRVPTENRWSLYCKAGKAYRCRHRIMYFMQLPFQGGPLIPD